MLSKGFSLFEMLLAMMISSAVMLGITTFYPFFYHQIMKGYYQLKLAESTDNALARIIKDIKRAGYNASFEHNASPSTFINASESCLILYYDAHSQGNSSRNNKVPHLSGVFAYRYKDGNIESQTGATNCHQPFSRWDKLFDQNESTVTFFKITKQHHHVEINIAVTLKKHPNTHHEAVYFVSIENAS